MRRLAVTLIAATHALQVLDYGPGRNHDLVEVGTDSIYVDFDEAVTACDPNRRVPSASIHKARTAVAATARQRPMRRGGSEVTK